MIALPVGAEIAGTYRVEARLGGGAFGTVYRVQHRFLGRMALKLIDVKSVEDLELLAREGVSHAALSHPNITRVFDANATEIAGDPVFYIASEYMAMGDLDVHLSQVQRLTLQEWAILVDNVLSALAYAHQQEQPVLHRDIKAANIFGAGERLPVYKLGDFGVSVVMRTGQSLTGAAGTIAFQAPECAFGSYLIQSDLYSAALVFYRALAGVYPFPWSSLKLESTHKESPSPPSKFRLDAPPKLDAVLLHALMESPFERYGSADQFRIAIANALPPAGHR